MQQQRNKIKGLFLNMIMEQVIIIWEDAHKGLFIFC